MYDMVVLLALTTQVAVDHLADWCRSICSSGQSSAFQSVCSIPQPLTAFSLRAHTWKPHMPYLDPVILQIFSQHLALSRFACPI